MPKENTEPNKSEQTKDGVTVTLEDGQEKTYTAEEITNLVKQQASATQKTQKAAPVLKLAEKYGADPEQLAAHADAAFTRLNQWKEQGLLDDNFEIIKQEATSNSPANSDPGQAGGYQPPAGNVGGVSEDKIAEVIQKALQPVNQRLDQFEQTTSKITNYELSTKLTEKYPDMGGDEIGKVFYRAKSDPQKNFWQHAEDVSKEQEQRDNEIFMKRAKSMGINIDEAQERNKLKEQAAEGGASAMFQNKKITLFPKKGENSVTAQDAAQQYIRSKEAFGS